MLAALLLPVALATGDALAADFDGDGTDDLLFRDRTRGDHRLAIVLGSRDPDASVQARSLILSANTLRTRGFEVRTGDFDGDGRTDILDRDLDSGRLRVRLMAGLRVRTVGTLSGPTSAEELQAVADFTGDGRADLLLRHSQSGDWRLLAMNGLAVLGGESGAAGFAQDPAWRLAGTADFNGDGRADVLLRRNDTLRWRIVLLDGLRVLGNILPDYLPSDPWWQMESIADLNRDARADLLLRNRDSGDWYAWHLDGARPLPSSGPVRIANGLVWRLQVLDDVNADNTVDAVLGRHDTGEWRADLLQESARLAGSGPIGFESTPEVRVAGSGDFDGDGVRELLVSDPEGWLLMDVRDPAAPVVRRPEIPPPRFWPLACEPPQRHQFGAPPKPSGAGADTAYLSWLRPATRENGEALCTHELSGYEIRYFRQGSSAMRTIDLNDPRADRRLIGPLKSGTWYFRILSIDSNGYFSQSSSGIAKTIP